MDPSVHSDTTDEDVANITAMFPEYSADDIKLDLTLTRNASQTVNRILDGQLVCSGSSSFAAGSTLPALPGDSSDDDDLPDLTPILPLWQRLKQKQAEVPNLSTKITSQPINTKNTVKHPISTEISDEEEPIKRLGSVSSVQETSASAQVSHQMSDSSDSDSFVTILPPVKKQKSNTESKSFMKSKFHQMSFEMSSDSDSSDSDSSDNCLLKDLPLSQERKSEISKSSDETVSLPLTKQLNCVDMNEDVYSDNYAYSDQIDTQESQDCNSQHTEATTDGNTQETLDFLSTDDSSQLSTNISELSKKEQIQLKKEKALRIRQEKEMEREKKKQEREEKKREKELEADRKRIIADERRKAQPKECIKFVTVVIDSELMQRTSGSNLIAGLQEALIRFEIQKQAMPNLITFWREVTKVNDTGQKLIRESSEEVQDNILLCMPVSEFVVYTHTYQQLKQGLITEDSTTLTDYIIQTRQILENKNITLIVQGLEQHFRDLGAAKLRAAKAKTERGRNPAMLAHLINKVDVQEVLLDVQIQCGGGIVFVESDEEFTKTVKQFTKAIAEAPYKRSRQNTAFSFNVDRTSAVRLVNDSDHERLWRQQIQQFKGVGSEVANAIIAAYATPRTLWNAYMECGSQKQAESLLQDIVVRRGYGVLATERRVGKELSRRLYQVITAQQPNILLT